ncbi:MAG: porin [Hydrogenophaga sp.]|jgi:predicted porin|uniref:porin n=1 Tax=Hydrogenophaga sp. TaxID=1904254 RepID=UPI0027289744|nr:porin [Hydrogenophaga sp.]MDO9483321.1 porin [Hydrogenophaga sp.]MDP3345530.1 porin [Hydrogenophaga sp.]MDP3925379.1 porin [Hydrogenophaga sp.]
MNYRVSVCQIAIAGTTAFAMSGMAYAQTSSVQIYGRVSAGISHLTNQTGAKTAVSNYLLNGSYLGFRGSEDLGGGIKAIFKMETGIDMDTGEAGSRGKFWNRESTVGLANESFTLTLGRQLHASTDRVTQSLDAFNVSGSSLHVTPLALFGVNKFAGNDSRSDDAIKLRWNGPAGVTAATSFSRNEGPGRSGAFDVAQITKAYTVGVYGVNFKSPTDPRREHAVFGAGGQLHLSSNARLYINLTKATLDGSAPGLPKQTNTLITPGFRYDMRPFIFKVSYTLDDGKNINNVDGRNGKKKTAIAAVDYMVSKRTAVSFALFSNAFTGGYRLDPVNIAALGRDPSRPSTSGYAIGIRHNF